MMTEEKEVISETNGKQVDNEDETELESNIIRQVEYYFGDLNLPRDKFLREQVNLDDGWVPLDILLTFNRLAKLSKDAAVIAKALNKSISGILEVSDDNKKVRRNPELPIPEMNEERRKELLSRTIYAKGFRKDSTVDEILKFFKQFEEVENIIMRKYTDRASKKKMFKGSVFVTFKTKEQAEKFLDTKDLKYEDKELLIQRQEAYLQQKQEEFANKKEMKDKKKDKEIPEKDDFKLPTGCVFHFSESTDKMTREDVKEALTPLGAEIAFIDFKVGDTQGWVRLTKENAAKEISEKITDGKIKIGDAEVVFRILEGDEENTYLVKTIEEMSKRRKNMKNNRSNKGKNFRGKQGGRKRKFNDNNDATPNKKRADS